MDTKEAGNYQVEDFVTDESFANYHFCLNTADQLFWEKWMLMHPDKATMAEQAIYPCRVQNNNTKYDYYYK